MIRDTRECRGVIYGAGVEGKYRTVIYQQNGT